MKERSYTGVREHKNNPPHPMKDRAWLYNCMWVCAADSPDTRARTQS